MGLLWGILGFIGGIWMLFYGLPQLLGESFAFLTEAGNFLIEKLVLLFFLSLLVGTVVVIGLIIASGI